VGCRSRGSSAMGPAGSASTSTGSARAPSESVDPAFDGCAHACGSRSAKDRREARPQPGVARGDATYCPVSGAVFRITDTTPHRESRGNTLFFCCESCAAFFTQHEAEVLAKRGLA
jgi:YHS domain-containing protein